MKELQNVWNLSATMDFNKDRYKTANKNVNRLTFVFERQQIHDGNKKFPLPVAGKQEDKSWEMNFKNIYVKRRCSLKKSWRKIL